MLLITSVVKFILLSFFFIKWTDYHDWIKPTKKEITIANKNTPIPDKKLSPRYTNKKINEMNNTKGTLASEPIYEQQKYSF